MKLKKWISLVFLFLAIAVLAVIGVLNLVRKFSRPEVRLDPVPFGISPQTRILEGRDFQIGGEAGSISPFSNQLVKKAEEYWESGRPDQAMTHLKEAVREDEKALPAYHLLIRYMLRSLPLDTAETERLIKKAILLDEGHPVIRLHYGDFFWIRGDFERARAEYETASNLSPGFPLPYIRLGKYSLFKEQFTLAEAQFRTAISLKKGGDKAPYDWLALAFYQMGQDDSAAAVIEYCKKIGLKSEIAQYVEGLLWEASGKLESAKAVYADLIQNYPDEKYRWAMNTLGSKPPRGRLTDAVGMNSRRWDEATEAIEILDPMVMQYSTNGPLWAALGQAYFKRQLYAHAVDCFDSALKYDSTLLVAVQFKDKALKNIAIHNPVKEVTKKVVVSPPEHDSVSAYYRKMEMASGHYRVRWGAYRSEVREAYPDVPFIEVDGQHLRYVFIEGRIQYESLLYFKDDMLWGIRVFATDTAKDTEDVFGIMLRQNSKISGEGKPTGSSYCVGYKPFQGVTWENDDTFEIMAQFKEKQWQVKLARVGSDYLKENPKLCDCLKLLNVDTWK